MKWLCLFLLPAAMFFSTGCEQHPARDLEKIEESSEAKPPGESATKPEADTAEKAVSESPAPKFFNH